MKYVLTLINLLVLLCVSAQSNTNSSSLKDIELKIELNQNEGKFKYADIDRIYRLQLDNENYNRATLLGESDFGIFDNFKSFTFTDNKFLLITTSKKNEQSFMENLEILLNEKAITVESLEDFTVVSD